ncbi:hypothetical protein G6L15_08305 [Agrobacterium rhizogenes]|uniref:hypothetical protein n=1 Tax=Rhizobium rhizogenes TaxID=359 RepID=UPI001573C094|nr:hypothetical protein [Rhizobium rhizogenes]NTG86146.1 hypothetical protein [Rhizobium rhizogenes]
MSKIVAYACSTRPNALWSAAQFDSAASKNRTECDIPLVALYDLEAERQRAEALKAMCDEMAKALEEAKFALFSGDMTIKDRADQSMRLVLAAYRKA